MKRIHLVGASGSGTTTLGRALAAHLDCPHFDTDHYYWVPTDPPFQKSRAVEARHAMLAADLSGDRWVLSGSLCGWGDVFIPRFDLVVFLGVPTEVRIARLRTRERERYGADAIAPGGRLHAQYEQFIAWAASYDDGPHDQRSRRMHEAWLAALACPVLRLEDTEDVPARLGEIVSAGAPGPTRSCGRRP